MLINALIFRAFIYDSQKLIFNLNKISFINLLIIDTFHSILIH
ncbi:hypothetical protein HMPREF3212_02942 [Citrobacter freundii]|nr:hypothetical protein HMPREF3212_02942 [Citrobacter freundii]